MAKVTNIDTLLDEVVTLPSLPNTVIQITDLINNPDSTLADIGKAISNDPSISLKSLRLVNSAYYALPNKITSVEHAAAMLGMKVIKNIVFTTSVFDTLKCEQESLIRHNVACGVALKGLVDSDLVDKKTFPHTDETFIIGLLHDVGKIVFAQYMSDEMETVAQTAAEGSMTWEEAETEIIGVTHSEMGASLARKWQLSDILIETIASHHDLTTCTGLDFTLSAAYTGIANYMDYEAGYPCYPGVKKDIDHSFWEAAGFGRADVQPQIDELAATADEINELVNLGG
jgi:putative nucleotidyltransferase with HDIG domain